MYGYIYKTTNTINNLIYIGQHKATKFEPNRYIGSGRALKRAFEEFGKENFICELIDIAENLEELNSKEEYWVDYYDSRNPLIGYNVKKGGEQLGLTGCCKIRRDEETLVVERASVKPYLDAGWVLTNTEETRAVKNSIKAKKYYQAHKEQILARNKIWRENHKERVKELQNKWEAEHHGRKQKQEQNKNYYEQHREECIEKAKQYRETNKDKMQEYYKQRYLANKQLYIERAQRSRANRKAEKN